MNRNTSAISRVPDKKCFTKGARTRFRDALPASSKIPCIMNLERILRVACGTWNITSVSVMQETCMQL